MICKGERFVATIRLKDLSPVMVDIVSQAVRSRMMSGIRGKNTGPELLIRKLLHKRGFRFRLHYKNLPGKPDIVMPRYQAVILIHGCFWHGHHCHLFKWPSSNEDFWYKKICRNKAVDEKVLTALLSGGWRVLSIWECALKGRQRRRIEDVVDEIVRWLNSDEQVNEIEGAHSEKKGSL